MKKKIESEKGSSTILISLFLLTLVVFGVLSIASSASELRLARRNAETNKMYYSLDAEGNRFLNEVKSAVRKSLNSMDSNNELFFSLLESNLNPGTKFILKSDGSGMIIERTIILEVNSYNRHLDIKVEISKPTNSSQTKDICSVIEWRLWQEPFEYNNKIDLWEGNP